MALRVTTCMALVGFSFSARPNMQPGGVPAKGGWRGSTLSEMTSTGYKQSYGHELHLFRVFGWENCRDFNDDELAFAQRGGILWYSIQPKDWAEAAGASHEATIRRCANVVKGLGEKKVFVSVGHEPDIHCEKNTTHGYWGSPADYRAMRRNFHSVFDAEGVTNVVWVMDYSRNVGYPLSDATSSWHNVAALWPGDDLVDWLFFNIFSDQPVSSGAYERKGDFQAQMRRIYDRLEQNAASGHNFVAATWGIGAFGAMEHEWTGEKISDADRSAFIDAAASALDDKLFPSLRALVYFDSDADNDSTISNGMMKSYKSYLDREFFRINDASTSVAPALI